MPRTIECNTSRIWVTAVLCFISACLFALPAVSEAATVSLDASVTAPIQNADQSANLPELSVFYIIGSSNNVSEGMTNNGGFPVSSSIMGDDVLLGTGFLDSNAMFDVTVQFDSDEIKHVYLRFCDHVGDPATGVVAWGQSAVLAIPAPLAGVSTVDFGSLHTDLTNHFNPPAPGTIAALDTYVSVPMLNSDQSEVLDAGSIFYIVGSSDPLKGGLMSTGGALIADSVTGNDVLLGSGVVGANALSNGTFDVTVSYQQVTVKYAYLRYFDFVGDPVTGLVEWGESAALPIPGAEFGVSEVDFGALHTERTNIFTTSPGGFVAALDAFVSTPILNSTQTAPLTSAGGFYIVGSSDNVNDGMSSLAGHLVADSVMGDDVVLGSGQLDSNGMFNVSVPYDDDSIHYVYLRYFEYLVDGAFAWVSWGTSTVLTNPVPEFGVSSVDFGALHTTDSDGIYFPPADPPPEVVALDVYPMTPSNVHEITLGEDIQFTAIAVYDDGTSNEVTALANWGSMDPWVMSFSNSTPGLAQSEGPGVSFISAVFDSVSSETHIVLVNPSTSGPPSVIDFDIYAWGLPDNPTVGIATVLYFVAEAAYDDGTTNLVTPSVPLFNSNTNVLFLVPGTQVFTEAWTVGEGFSFVGGVYEGFTSVVQVTVIEAPTGSPPSGLLAHWPMDEGSGTAVSDATGNGHDGILWSSNVWDNGYSGSGLSFDNGFSSMYVGGALISNGYGSNWTFTCRFKYPLVDAFGGWNVLVRSTLQYPIIVNEATGLLGSWIGVFHSSGFDINSLSEGWHHLSAVFGDGGTTTKFYMDGQLVGSHNVQPALNILAIGGGYSSVTQPWGTIDEVSLYGDALSASEVLGLYEEGLINQPPIVHAGPDQTITLPNHTINLDGTITDDGLPSNSVSVTWTKVSGFGAVTFGDAHSEDTTATFSTNGIYMLVLTADDGELLGFDAVTITVDTPPSLVGLDIFPVGFPDHPTVTVGTDIPYRAIAYYDNATSNDITENVAWFSSSPWILDFSSPTAGLAHAVGEGMSFVNAQLDGISSAAQTVVVESVSAPSIVVTPPVMTNVPVIEGGTTCRYVHISNMGDSDLTFSLSGLGGAIPTFADSHTIFSSNGAPVEAIDVDSDGDLDLLSIYDWVENIAGDGSTWVEREFQTNVVKTIVSYAADMNGDGDTDLCGVFQTVGGPNPYPIAVDIRWWESPGPTNAAWIEHVIPTDVAPFYYNMHGADIDGDGDEDVFFSAYVGYNNHPLIWVENVDGLGTIWTQHTTSMNVGSTLGSSDIDGDGDIDVLAGSANTLFWLENLDGAGGSWSNRHIADRDGSGSRMADMNGDGWPDVQVGRVWLENPKTSGTVWVQHVIDGQTNASANTYLADIDGDGDIDVLSAPSYFYPDYNEAWWENVDGAGLVWIPHSLGSIFDNVTQLGLGDLDGDGDPDIIGSYYSAPLRQALWWENDAEPPLEWLSADQLSGIVPPGSNATIKLTFDATGYTAGDHEATTLAVNSNDPDTPTVHVAVSMDVTDPVAEVPQLVITPSSLTSEIVAGTMSNDVITIQNTGTAPLSIDVVEYFHWSSYISVEPLPFTTNLPPGGACQLLVTRDASTLTPGLGEERTIKILSNDPLNQTNYVNVSMDVIADPTLAPAMVYTHDTLTHVPVPAGSTVCRTLTIANTGNVELAAALVHGSAAEPTFIGPESILSEPYNYSTHIIDADGDGDLDIFAQNIPAPWQNLSLLENVDGSGTNWQQHAIWSQSTNGSVTLTEAIDINGDGFVDVCGFPLGTSFEPMRWWKNPGTNGGFWVEHTTPIVLGGYHARLSAADMDGDGDGDILLGGDSFSNTASWVENVDGNGTVWATHQIQDWIGAYTLHPADMDNDGDLDVVGGIWFQAYAPLTWWEQTESPTGWVRHVISATSADNAKIVDVNGDGWLDIVGVANYTPGYNNNAWWRNPGDSGGAWIQHVIGDGPRARLGAGDIDGDGDVDILGASESSDNYVWWENLLGSGTAWQTHEDANLPAIAYPNPQLVDLNGDGFLDVMDRLLVSMNSGVWRPEWVSIEPAAVLVPPGSNVAVDVCFDAEGFEPGDYAPWMFVLNSDDPNVGPQVLSVSMDVVGAGPSLVDFQIFAEDIANPPVVELGAPISFVGEALYSDGTSNDVTASTTWLSFNPSIVQFTSSTQGMAWAVGTGTTYVAGLFDSFTSVVQVVVTEVATAPQIAVTPTSISNLFVVEGTVSNRTITVRNNGNEELSVSSYIAPGPPSNYRDNVTPHIQVSPYPFSCTLAPGQETNLAVRFDASALGAGNSEFGVLAMNSNDPQTPRDIVYMSMHVIENDSLSPEIWVSTSNISNVPVTVGTSTCRYMYVENTGSVDLAYTISNAGDVPPVFTNINIVSLTNTYFYMPIDMDGDGDMDVLSTRAGQQVRWQENVDGDGNLWEEYTIMHRTNTDTFGTSSVYPADVDGDGDEDVIEHYSYCGRSGVCGTSARWLLVNPGTATGEWDRTPFLLGGLEVQGAGDIDNDGDLDLLAVAGNAGSYALGRINWFENLGGEGTNWVSHALASSGAYDFAAFADIDNDGDPDVVASGWGDLHWYENTDGLVSNWNEHVFSPSRGIIKELADVDGDGWIDVLGIVGSDTVWWKNPGSSGGEWLQSVIYGDQFSNISAADFDGDGDQDLLIDDAWLGNSLGSGDAWVLHAFDSPLTSARDLYAADMNGDSRADLLGAIGLDLLWWGNDAQSAVDWLTVAPQFGIVPPGSNVMIDICFDASGYDPGDHEATTLVLNSNDPDTPSINIPVSMDVIAGGGSGGTPDLMILPFAWPNVHVDVGTIEYRPFILFNAGTADLDVSVPPSVTNIAGGVIYTEPLSMTLAPAEYAAGVIAFDGTDLTVGTHVSGFLPIVSSDPHAPTTMMRVAMTVLPVRPRMMAEPPFTFGSVNAVACNDAGAISYMAQCSMDTNGIAAEDAAWQPGTEFVFSGLEDGQLYYYRAKAMVNTSSGTLESAWSDWVASRQLSLEGDYDGDGMRNDEEAASDTSPTDATSALRIERVTLEGDEVIVEWSGGQNVYQYLECIDSLDSGAEWKCIYTNAPPTPRNNLLRRNQPDGPCYYRLKVMQP